MNSILGLKNGVGSFRHTLVDSGGGTETGEGGRLVYRRLKRRLVFMQVWKLSSTGKWRLHERETQGSSVFPCEGLESVARHEFSVGGTSPPR